MPANTEEALSPDEIRKDRILWLTMNTPKKRSFTGDETTLTFADLAGDHSPADPALFGGATATEASTSPPPFVASRCAALPHCTSAEARSFILSRDIVVQNAADGRTAIAPLQRTNLVEEDTGRRIGLLNLTPLLPGRISTRFLNDGTLLLLPHCVEVDVRTAATGVCSTPETYIDARTPPFRFSSDVPERYYMRAALDANGYLQGVTYHPITPFVRRPHSFTCVENRALFAQPLFRGEPQQWIVIAGELMPGQPDEAGSALGIVYIDALTNTLRHTLALSPDTRGDMISSVELGLLPNTLLVCMRHGGVFVVQAGRVAQHIQRPSTSHSGLVAARSLDPQIVCAHNCVGRSYLRDVFFPGSNWDSKVCTELEFDGMALLNVPNPALLVGARLSAMQERDLARVPAERVARRVGAGAAEDGSVPPALHRFAECTGNFYFSESQAKLYMQSRKRYTLLCGTVGGEVVVASVSSLVSKNNPKPVLRSGVLRLSGGAEGDSVERALAVHVVNEIDESVEHKEAPVEFNPQIGEVASNCITQVCSFPRNAAGEGVVAALTAGGLLMVFPLKIRA